MEILPEETMSKPTYHGKVEGCRNSSITKCRFRSPPRLIHHHLLPGDLLFNENLAVMSKRGIKRVWDQGAKLSKWQRWSWILMFSNRTSMESWHDDIDWYKILSYLGRTTPSYVATGFQMGVTYIVSLDSPLNPSRINVTQVMSMWRIFIH